MVEKLDKNISVDQSNAIREKSKIWRDYLQYLSENLDFKNDFYLHKINSLWASTFSYIEWLVVFYLYKTYPSKNDIATVLERSWAWDKDIGEIFWGAGRHPIAHVGQTNTFHSFSNFRNIPTNVNFDQNKWSKKVVADWDKYHPFKAVSILPPLDIEDKKIQIIVFYHQMILHDLLPKLETVIVEKIKREKDIHNLNKIYKLNKQILH